jgi:hypothetical protein
MTDIQRVNLSWLALAMTAPEFANERYYYDAITELFFYTKYIEHNTVALYSFLDYPLSEREYNDISVRLELIDEETCEIVEIPRFSVQEKIATQLDFLCNIKTGYNLNDLITAVVSQKDDYRMVLDIVLNENSEYASLASFWEEFKLKTVFTSINRFTSKVGIELKFD